MQQPPPNNQPPQGWGPPQQQYPQQPPSQPLQNWQQYPQMPMQQPPKKKSKLPLILGIIAAILVLGCISIFVLAATNASKTNTGTAVNTSTSGNTPSTSGNTPAPTNQHFKIGQVVKVGDTWQVTINSVKVDQGSQYFKPKSGMTWLIFSITAKNISSQEQIISSALNFHLQDPSGQKYNETIDPNAGATLDGKVEANSPSKGVIVYEVPASTHDFQFAFEPDVTSSGQSIWDIHI